MARGKAAILLGRSQILTRSFTPGMAPGFGGDFNRTLPPPPRTGGFGSTSTGFGPVPGGPSIQPPSPSDSGLLGGVLDRVGGAVVDRLTGEIVRRINPGSSGTAGGNPLSPGGFTGGTGGLGPCPTGAIRIGTRCVNPLAAAPGGTPLVTDVFGEAVVGAFGMAALVPAIVGEINGRPIRKCPGGSVLGKDNLCYNKIPNNFRKWPKKAKAPVTAADAKAIRRAEATKNRVKKLATNVGFTCKKR